MSKICKSCGFISDDSTVFCPACGTVFDDSAGEGDSHTLAANDSADRISVNTPGTFARPINVDVRPLYARPVQAQPQFRPVSTNPPAPASKPKKRLPYILLGVGAAAIIFAVALIIILTSDPKKNDSFSGGVAVQTSTDAPVTDSKTVPAGTYQMTEVTGSDELESVKDDITLEVKSDGTAKMLMYGTYTVSEMEFDEELGIVSFESSKVPYTVSGNTITIEDSTGKLVFEK